MTTIPVNPMGFPIEVAPDSVAQPVAARAASSVLVPLGSLAPAESRAKRMTFLAIALALTAFIGVFHFTYLVPAHSGVDQNGYLVGGRMLADHGSMRLDGFNPDLGRVDYYIFVGRMWVGADLGTDERRFYPKYPIGLPALVALALKIGGPKFGPVLAYWINPFCMTLAMLAVFLLVRLVAGSFAGILATITVAVSQVTMGLATNPNSHASTLFFVTWGMYLLLRWWKRNSEDYTDSLHPVVGALSALGAGLLIGYAATIRYTEALLLLPVLIVAVFNYRRRSRRSLVESGLLLCGWSIPVLALVCYNVASVKALTGYDPTNESTGFSVDYFLANWHTMLHQLHDTGLPVVFPIALFGLPLMFFWNWRLALVITSWIVPCVLTYTAYYWAPDGGTGYLRFFLTVFPALALSAFWIFPVLAELIGQLGDNIRRLRVEGVELLRVLFVPVRVGLLLAALFIAGFSVLLSFPGALAHLDSDQHSRLLLDFNTRQVLETLERNKCKGENAVIFGTDDSVLHHVQFATGARCYNLSSFGEPMRRFSPDPDAPQGLDPARVRELSDRGERVLVERIGMSIEEIEQVRKLRSADPKNMTPEIRRSLERISREVGRIPLDERREIIAAALAAGHQVYVLGSIGQDKRGERVVSPAIDEGFSWQVVATWNISLPEPKSDFGKDRRRNFAKGQQFRFNFQPSPRGSTHQITQLFPPQPQPRVQTPDPATYLNQPRPSAAAKPF